VLAVADASHSSLAHAPTGSRITQPPQEPESALSPLRAFDRVITAAILPRIVSGWLIAMLTSAATVAGRSRFKIRNAAYGDERQGTRVAGVVGAPEEGNSCWRACLT
jgi:hypothetical protein